MANKILDQLKNSLEQKKAENKPIASGETLTGRYVSNLSDEAKRQARERESYSVSDNYSGGRSREELINSPYADIYKSLGVLENDNKTQKKSTSETIDDIYNGLTRDVQGRVDRFTGNTNNVTGSTAKAVQNDANRFRTTVISSRLGTLKSRELPALEEIEPRLKNDRNDEPSKNAEQAVVENNGLKKTLEKNKSTEVANTERQKTNEPKQPFVRQQELSSEDKKKQINEQHAKRGQGGIYLDLNYMGDQAFKSLVTAIHGIDNTSTAFLNATIKSITNPEMSFRERMTSSLNEVNERDDKDYTYQQIMSHYGDDNKYSYDSVEGGVNRLATDTVKAIAYMVPSIVASAATGGAGVVSELASGAVLFTQGFDNSYREALNDGATEDQALNFAFLESLNNSVGEHLVGGVSGIGEGLLTKPMNALAMKLGSTPFARTVLNRVISSLGEGGEEMLQDVISNINKRLTYDPNAKMDIKDVLYDGLIGITMSAAMGGVNDVATYQVYQGDYEFIKSVVDAGNSVQSQEDYNELKYAVDMYKSAIDFALQDETISEEDKGRLEYLSEAIDNTMRAVEDNRDIIIESNNAVTEALNNIADSPAVADENGVVKPDVKAVIDAVEDIYEAQQMLYSDGEYTEDETPSDIAIDKINDSIDALNATIETQPDNVEAQVNKAVLENVKQSIEENREQIDNAVIESVDKSESEAEAAETDAITESEATTPQDVKETREQTRSELTDELSNAIMPSEPVAQQTEEAAKTVENAPVESVSEEQTNTQAAEETQPVEPVQANTNESNNPDDMLFDDNFDTEDTKENNPGERDFTARKNELSNTVHTDELKEAFRNGLLVSKKGNIKNSKSDITNALKKYFGINIYQNSKNNNSAISQFINESTNILESATTEQEIDDAVSRIREKAMELGGKLTGATFAFGDTTKDVYRNIANELSGEWAISESVVKDIAYELGCDESITSINNWIKQQNAYYNGSTGIRLVLAKGKSTIANDISKKLDETNIEQIYGQISMSENETEAAQIARYIKLATEATASTKRDSDNYFGVIETRTGQTGFVSDLTAEESKYSEAVNIADQFLKAYADTRGFSITDTWSQAAEEMQSKTQQSRSAESVEDANQLTIEDQAQMMGRTSDLDLPLGMSQESMFDSDELPFERVTPSKNRRTVNDNSQQTQNTSNTQSTQQHSIFDRYGDVVKSRKTGKTVPVLSQQKLENLINNTFGIVTGYGHINQRGVLGWNDRGQNTIRTRSAGQLGTLCHETGHWLADNTGFEEYIFDNYDSNSKVHEALNEIYSRYGMDLFSRGYNVSQVPGECIAEYFREYMQDFELQERNCPKFTKVMREYLDNHDSKINAKIDNVAEHVTAFTRASDSEKTQASIYSKSDNSKIRSLAENAVENFSKGTLGRTVGHYYKVAERIVFDDIAELKRRSPEAYKFAMYSRYSSSLAGGFILNATRDVNLNVTGMSLQDVLQSNGFDDTSKTFKKDKAAFEEYLIRQVVIDVCENGDESNIIPDDVSHTGMNTENLNDLASNISAVEELERLHPNFKKASEDLYAYINRVVEYGIDSGVYDASVMNELNNNYKHYVPTHRRFTKDDSTVAHLNHTGFANQNNPLRRREGSKRDIFAPIEEVIEFTNNVISISNKNRAMQSLVRDIVGDGDTRNGYLMEQVEGAGGNNVVSVLVNGNKNYYQVHDNDLFASITAMDELAGFNRFDSVAGFTSSIFKTLTTVVNPVFLVKNTIRDNLSAYIRTPTRNFTKNKGGAVDGAIYIGDFAKAAYDVWNTTDIAEEYAAIGGEHTGFMGSTIHNYAVTNRNLLKMRNKMFTKEQKSNANNIVARWFVDSVVTPVRHPIKSAKNGFDKVSEVSETPTRLAEYKRQLAQGASKIDAFLASQEVSVNFKRHGSAMKHVNLAVPYSNAAIQGFITSVASVIPTNKENAIRLGKFVTASITTAALQSAWKYIVAHLLFDDEDEQDIINAYNNLSPWTRNQYYCFYSGDGKFKKIPKSQEYGALESFIERMVECGIDDNEDAFFRYGEYIVGMLPLYSIDDVNIIGTMYQIGINETFTGSPVVPSSLENVDNKAQFDKNTSAFAKEVGKMINVSPMVIDYFNRQQLGVVGKIEEGATKANSDYGNMALNLLGDISSGVAGLFESGFVADELWSNAAVSKFYDDKTKIDKNAGAYEKVGEYDGSYSYRDKYESNKYYYLHSLYGMVNSAVKEIDDTDSQRELRKELVDIVDAFNDTGYTDMDDFVCRISELAEYNISDITPYLRAPDKVYVTQKNGSSYKKIKDSNNKNVSVPMSPSDAMEYYIVGQNAMYAMYQELFSKFKDVELNEKQAVAIADEMKNIKSNIESTLKNNYANVIINRNYGKTN